MVRGHQGLRAVQHSGGQAGRVRRLVHGRACFIQHIDAAARSGLKRQRMRKEFVAVQQEHHLSWRRRAAADGDGLDVGNDADHRVGIVLAQPARGKIILKMVFRQRAFAQRLGCEIGKFVDDIEKLVRAHPHRGGDDLVGAAHIKKIIQQEIPRNGHPGHLVHRVVHGGNRRMLHKELQPGVEQGLLIEGLLPAQLLGDLRSEKQTTAQRDEQNKGIRKQEERVYAALFLFGPVRRGFFCRHPGVPPPGVNAEFPPGKAARRAAPGGNALLIMVREKERFVK